MKHAYIDLSLFTAQIKKKEKKKKKRQLKKKKKKTNKEFPIHH